jgi:hypothetical protein
VFGQGGFKFSLGTLKLFFAPEERHVYSNKPPLKYSSVREERKVFPIGQCARLLRSYGARD